MTQTTAQTQIPNHRGWILFAVCIVAFMVQIDYTAVNVGLESMARTVHSNLTTIQWVLSAYVLAWGSMVIPAGRLADLYGKRRMFILGNVLFLLGSTLTGLSTTAWMLIASRVLQGVGGAIFLPAIYTLIFTAYPNKERGKAMGILTSAFAIGMAIGPTLGGVILHLLDWRYIFFINIPFGLLVISLILKYGAKEKRKLLDEPMDFIGSALLAFSFVVFMLCINLIKVDGLSSTHTLFGFLTFIVLISALLIYETKYSFPILKLSLFQNKSFLGCILSYILLGYNFAAILIIGGLYLQNTLNYNAFETGLIFLSMTVGFGVLSAYAGRLCDRFDARLMITLGGVSLVAGTLIFINLTPTSSLTEILIMFFLCGIGLGFAFPALNLSMMSAVKENELNVASGTFTLFGCLGNTIGLIMSAVSIVYFGQNYLLNLISKSNLTLSQTQTQALKTLIASAHYSSQQLANFSKDMIPTVLENLHLSFVYAISKSLTIALILSLLSIVIGVTLIKVKK